MRTATIRYATSMHVLVLSTYSVLQVRTSTYLRTYYVVLVLVLVLSTSTAVLVLVLRTVQHYY